MYKVTLERGGTDNLGMCLRRGDPASSVGIKTSAGNKRGMCQASQKIAEKGGRFRGNGETTSK